MNINTNEYKACPICGREIQVTHNGNLRPHSKDFSAKIKVGKTK